MFKPHLFLIRPNPALANMVHSPSFLNTGLLNRAVPNRTPNSNNLNLRNFANNFGTLLI
jgi:hypothetical protein